VAQNRNSSQSFYELDYAQAGTHSDAGAWGLFGAMLVILCARFALLCGMWAFFFALFGWPYVALLLGALALNWGISALRAKPRTPNPDTPAPSPGTGGVKRQQRTAAISGLVTASLALAMVAGTIALQFVYRDYYTCTNDALTTTSQKACADLLPKPLRKVLSPNS
jgi:hypothetical protein